MGKLVYTNLMIDDMRKNYECCDIVKYAEYLGVTPKSLKNKAFSLGLRNHAIAPRNIEKAPVLKTEKTSYPPGISRPKPGHLVHRMRG